MWGLYGVGVARLRCDRQVREAFLLVDVDTSLMQLTDHRGSTCNEACAEAMYQQSPEPESCQAVSAPASRSSGAGDRCCGEGRGRADRAPQHTGPRCGETTSASPVRCCAGPAVRCLLARGRVHRAELTNDRESCQGTDGAEAPAAGSTPRPDTENGARRCASRRTANRHG